MPCNSPLTLILHQLEGQIAQLQKELERESKERNYFQVLRDKSYTFWEISKKQLEEKEADLKNRDKEMEEAAERRQADIRVLVIMISILSNQTIRKRKRLLKTFWYRIFYFFCL